MAKEPMPDHIFERLLTDINQETHLVDKKVEILFRSRGFFSADQASRLLYAFSNSTDRLRAIQILEARLCRMSCSEARDIVGTFTIANDKVKALSSIKRYLCDADTREGQEDVMTIFPFGVDEVQRVLYTARSDQADLVAAGGHQGYAALGGLYTQCRPLVPHLYGSIAEQNKQKPGHGRIEIPVEAKAATLPSVYSGHPSYAYPSGRTYADDREYMTQDPQVAPSLPEYPAGAPPLGMHQGGPAPTGFQIYRNILSD